MKKLVKLNGAKVLSKNEQKSINGGVDTGFCLRMPEGTSCGGIILDLCYQYQCHSGICVKTLLSGPGC